MFCVVRVLAIPMTHLQDVKADVVLCSYVAECGWTLSWGGRAFVPHSFSSWGCELQDVETQISYIQDSLGLQCCPVKGTISCACQAKPKADAEAGQRTSAAWVQIIFRS